MSTIYVHTLGDSTLDNVFWMLNGNGTNPGEAKQNSVEGQLEQILNENNINSKYEVISHAYDGFETKHMLGKGVIGSVLTKHNEQKYESYLKIKDFTSQSVFPLNDLKTSMSENEDSDHYVPISVGGNDFRVLLQNWRKIITEIPNIRARYLRIVNEVINSGNNVKPILVLLYRVDFNHDTYGIYKVLEKIGLVFACIHSISVLGIVTAASIALIAKKVSRLSALIFILSSVSLFASQRFLSLKVTKGILSGQNAGMAALGGLLETFYRPILNEAREKNIPVLDLPNAFNPHDSSLYISQIEPSREGGWLIATGVDHIVKNHDFSDNCKTYSFEDSAWKPSEDSGWRSSDPRHWQVLYPQKA